MNCFLTDYMRRWLLGLLIVVSCSRSVDEAGFRAYLQEPGHGLVQQVSAEAGTAICAYRPTDAIVAQEVRNNALPTTPATMDSLRRAYEGRRYFTLSLAQNGMEIENQFVSDKKAYGDAIAYLNTGIAQDAFLAVPGQDSVAAMAAAYPRLYGNTGRSTGLLVFDTSHLPLDKDFHITLHDRLFGLGTMRFTFRAADLAAIPRLAF